MKKTESEDEDNATTGEYEVVFGIDGTKTNINVVKTGVQDDEFIQIVEGLKVGDKIVIGPYDVVSKKLKNGSTVKTTSKKSSSEADKE
jgi:HlyD family secretion protein